MIPISLMGHYFSMDTLLYKKEKEKKSHVDKLINGPQYIHSDIIALINLKQQRPGPLSKRPSHHGAKEWNLSEVTEVLHSVWVPVQK